MHVFNLRTCLWNKLGTTFSFNVLLPFLLILSWHLKQLITTLLCFEDTLSSRNECMLLPVLADATRNFSFFFFFHLPNMQQGIVTVLAYATKSFLLTTCINLMHVVTETCRRY